MTKTALFYACCLLVLGTIASAQTIPTVTAQPNTIYVGADGKYEAAPDTAVLRMDIATQQDTARAAYDKVAAGAEQVRKALRDNGVDAKAMQVGFYAVQPMYDWKSPKHRVIGYRVTTNVTLKLRDFSKIGPLTAALANIDEAENQSVSYDLEDIELAKSKAAEDALKKARTQANAIAVTGGRSLGELLFASSEVSQPVIVPMAMGRQPMMARAEAAPAPTAEFSPQNVTITAHVSALFALK
ncbi:MAG TPA: SIMPL domain-containing protein [Terriglobales bacterium]|nr:SIMPL domain-containing protein [Terriglobales bacterium]